jgi:hypothetical protein
MRSLIYLPKNGGGLHHLNLYYRIADCDHPALGGDDRLRLRLSVVAVFRRQKPGPSCTFKWGHCVAPRESGVPLAAARGGVRLMRGQGANGQIGVQAVTD